MKKSIVYLFFSLMFIACGGDDNSVTMVDDEPMVIEDDSPMDDVQDDSDSFVAINLDGVPDLDLDALEVKSANGSTVVDSDNMVEDIFDSENPDLPVIFTKNGNVLMGYFPDALDEKELEVEDVVYFFFKSYPALAVRRLGDDTLKNLLLNSSGYGTMVGLVKDALNRNESVIDNPQFDDIVRGIVAEYDESLNDTGKVFEDGFKFEYSRNGEIAIPNEVPLFASLGVQITPVGSGEPVFGPKILDTKSLVLSPGSLFNFLLDEFVFAPEPLTENYTLPEDGSYEIVFSNGRSGYAGLDDAVKTQNYKYFGVTVLGYAVPFGLEKLIKNQSCKEEIAGLLEVSRQFASNLVQNGTRPTPEDLIEYVVELGGQTKDLAICYTTGSGGFAGFFPDIVGFLNKRLSVAEDIAELTFFGRDFFASDISGLETRYYKDGISVGYLNQTEVSSTSFGGSEGEVFNYESLVEEQEVSYDVDRGLTSTFVKNEEMKPSAGLPFEYEKTGDVAVSVSSPVSTDNQGRLKLDLTVGEQDSEVTLSPQFESPEISDTSVIISFNEDDEEVVDLTGNWTLIYNLCPPSNNEGSNEFILSDDSIIWVDILTSFQQKSSNFSFNEETGELSFNISIQPSTTEQLGCYSSTPSGEFYSSSQYEGGINFDGVLTSENTFEGSYGLYQIVPCSDTENNNIDCTTMNAIFRKN